MRELGDDAAAAAAGAYHRIVIQIVEDHSGRAIGAAADTVLSVFPRARDAVFAAVAITDALRDREWIAATHRPDVAAAVHSGRVVDANARHLGTPALSVSLLCSEAAGSQVLLSDTAYGLLEGEPLAPFALRYVDDRVISNDDMPRRVFELVRPPAAV